MIEADEKNTADNILVTEPLMEVRNISKRFPGVVALDDVSLQFLPGEVHAIVGENGAGEIYLNEDRRRALIPLMLERFTCLEIRSSSLTR